MERGRRQNQNHPTGRQQNHLPILAVGRLEAKRGADGIGRTEALRAPSPQPRAAHARLSRAFLKKDNTACGRAARVEKPPQDPLPAPVSKEPPHGRKRSEPRKSYFWMVCSPWKLHVLALWNDEGHRKPEWETCAECFVIPNTHDGVVHHRFRTMMEASRGGRVDLLRTRFGEAASQMKKDGVRNPLAGAQVPKSQTSSDLRHKPASIHGVIGGAMTPAASRPPLMREHGLRRGEWMYLKVLEVDCRD